MSENSNGTVLPGAGRLVLVSDAAPNIRALLTLVLEEEGYSVVSAASGEEALATSASTPTASFSLSRT